MNCNHCYYKAIKKLEEDAIETCLLRDEYDEIDFLDEVDLLVNKKNKKATLQILQKLGWEILDKGIFIPHKVTLYYLQDGQLCKIDLHFELVDYGLIYMDAEAFIKETTFKNGLRVPSRSSWLLHVILHTILGKDKLSKKYHQRIDKLFQHPKTIEDTNKLINTYKLSRVIADINSLSTQVLTDKNYILQKKKSLKKHLKSNNINNLLSSVYQKVIWPCGQLLGLRRGLTIAFIGPDGAGKSTTIDALTTKLEKSFSIPTRTIYMGPWEYPILYSSKLLRRIGANPLDEIPGANTSSTKKLKGLIKRHLYYINTFFEVWSRYLIKVLPRLLYRRVVLLDRFTYDIEVGYYNTILKNSAKLRGLISKLSPKPTLTVLLVNEANIIWERKKEYPLEVITQSLDKYKEIGRKYQATELNTNQPIEKMIDIFVEENWRTLIKYRKEGLFRANS